MGLSRRSMLRLLAAAPLVRRVWTFDELRAAPIEVEGRLQPDPTDRGQPDVHARLQVGLFSRHLQWASVDEAIDVARQIGFDAIEWTVRPGAHIAPERVEQDLPKVVEASRRAGLAVSMIATDILDARSAFADPILRTAHGLGIRYYRSALFRYDYSGDLEQQLEALKPRVATLVELNQRHNMTIAYHTHSGRGNIGGNVWDLWMVIRQFDPQVIGLNYDTGHATSRGGSIGWTDAAHAALKYIRCLAVKDSIWTRRPDGAWVVEFCPIGAGMADFKGIFALLKSGGFRGPINLHVEHDNLLGTDVGTWKLDMPRERFIAIVKYDLDRVRALMKDAQLG